MLRQAAVVATVAMLSGIAGAGLMASAHAAPRLAPVAMTTLSPGPTPSPSGPTAPSQSPTTTASPTPTAPTPSPTSATPTPSPTPTPTTPSPTSPGPASPDPTESKDPEPEPEPTEEIEPTPEETADPVEDEPTDPATVEASPDSTSPDPSASTDPSGEASPTENETTEPAADRAGPGDSELEAEGSGADGDGGVLSLMSSPATLGGMLLLGGMALLFVVLWRHRRAAAIPEGADAAGGFDPYAAPPQYSYSDMYPGAEPHYEPGTGRDYEIVPGMGPAAAPYAEQQYGGDPYAGQPYAGDPYGGDPYAGDPYAGQQYAGDPYGGDPYAGGPYAGQPYGGDPYAGGPYAAEAYEAGPPDFYAPEGPAPDHGPYQPEAFAPEPPAGSASGPPAGPAASEPPAPPINPRMAELLGEDLAGRYPSSGIDDAVPGGDSIAYGDAGTVETPPRGSDAAFDVVTRDDERPDTDVESGDPDNAWFSSLPVELTSEMPAIRDVEPAATPEPAAPPEPPESSESVDLYSSASDIGAALAAEEPAEEVGEFDGIVESYADPVVDDGIGKAVETVEDDHDDAEAGEVESESRDGRPEPPTG